MKRGRVVLDVVMLPGFGGAATQPMLVALEKRLVGLPVRVRRLAPPRGRPTPTLAAEVAWLEARLAEVEGPHLVVGRSFGGRLAVRVGAQGRLAGCVLLGFPVRPPGKPRPLDEAALRHVRCPTLVVQGSVDALGPLAVVRALARKNRRVEVEVIDGAGHALPARALDVAAGWIARLAARVSGDRPRRAGPARARSPKEGSASRGRR